MQLYPEVQRKAQAEIDAEIGQDRLPVFADRQNLPYVDAIAKEIIRYNTVVPLCAFLFTSQRIGARLLRIMINRHSTCFHRR